MKTFSGDGGVTLETDLLVYTASLGLWGIGPSPSGQLLAAGFYLLATLETESLSAKGCKEGSVKLMGASFFAPTVTTLEM